MRYFQGVLVVKSSFQQVFLHCRFIVKHYSKTTAMHVKQFYLLYEYVVWLNHLYSLMIFNVHI